MTVSVERQGNEATVKINVPASEVGKGFAQAIKKIANQVNIPGFRKGKAPRNIIENFVGKEAIAQEAFELVANKAYNQALMEEKLVPVDDPKVQDSKFEEGQDMEVTLTLTLKPEPELGEYKGLEVEYKVEDATEADVDAAIEDLRGRAAKMVVAEGAIIEKGDFAIIDFAGTVDGKPFSGGEGKGYPLEVGSGSFIPGFEEQLVGLKAGDSTDVDVTFPEEYFVKELAGKEAVFKVNVQDVKRKELPEVNDEFAKANSKFETIAELRADMLDRMQKGAVNEAKVAYDRALILKAVENAKFDVPEIMVEDRVSRMLEEMEMNLQSRKMNMEMYLQYTGQTMEDLRAAQKETALENVKTDLVLDAIAKAEELQLSEEEVNHEIEVIASQHGADVAEVKKIITENRNMGLLLANVLRKKAAHVIIDNAKK